MSDFDKQKQNSASVHFNTWLPAKRPDRHHTETSCREVYIIAASSSPTFIQPEQVTHIVCEIAALPQVISCFVALMDTWLYQNVTTGVSCCFLITGGRFL